MPVLHGVIDEAFTWPWENKSELAFWHGTDYCNSAHGKVACDVKDSAFVWRLRSDGATPF